MLELGVGHWSFGVGNWALELCDGHEIWAVEDGHWELGAGHQAPGTPEKSKVVTGASFYPFAWTFPEPVQSCATVRGLCQALKQKVKR